MPFDFVVDITKTGFYKQGEQQGLTKGLALGLTRILKKRFGPLPRAVTLRVQKASQKQLESWVDQVTEARTLADIFGN